MATTFTADASMGPVGTSAETPTALDPLFEPRSIAVVGASADRRKFGNRTIRILQKHGYRGAMYPVHASEAAIEGLTAHRSLGELPEAPDLVIVCLPAEAVPGVVDQACAAGARAIVVYASGFRESGEAGRALEMRILATANAHGVALLGPNCQGSANFHNGAVANFSLAMLDPMGPPGGLAIVGQSGLLGTVLTDGVRRQAGLNAGALVATGNEAQLDALSIATYLARERREIRAILLHLETIASLSALERVAAAAVESGTALCVLKVGRTAAGRSAATSHTGSMPVDEKLLAGACARLGIRQVRSVESAIRACRVMLHPYRERAAGRRVGIVSNSGGVGALFADLVSDAGLAVATLDAETRHRLDADLPGQAGGGFNPADVNVLPYSAPARYVEVVRRLAQDPGVDQVLLFLGMQRSNVAEIGSGIDAVQRESGKPIVACTMACEPELERKLEDAGAIVLSDTVAAVETLTALAEPARRLALNSIDRASSRRRPASARGPQSNASLWSGPWDEAHNAVFEAFRVDALPARHARDPDAAAACAGELGYPVAVKLYSRRHAHKSDIGGVRLGITSAAGVREACESFVSRLGEAVEGFVVQRMCPFPPVAEAFVGCKRDRTFGDVLLLGSGGIYVNEWNDAQVIVDAQDRASIEAAIDRLVLRPLFRPLRGKPGADVEALASTLRGLADLFGEMPREIAVFECNPVLLGCPGEGAFVADWRVEPGEVQA